MLPGLVCADAFVTEAEERALIARIGEAAPTPFLFQQWTGKRLTRSFGWSTDFQTGRAEPAEPIPAWLEPVRDRAARFAGIDPALFIQCLLIEYGIGAGIGWHKDRPLYEHIVGISLGAKAVMRFRRRRGTGFDRAAMPLAPRSIYHLGGEARSSWEHSIAEMSEPRWSITFRTLRAG